MTNFKIDLRDERLWREDRPVPISNKAFQLLRLFVSNPNRLLTKDHILNGVWRDVCVSEGLIKEYVSDLRQALDDDPKHPRFIETVHGRGYRFLGGVEESGCPDDTVSPTNSRSHPPSLAVLPMKNLTGEERWARFCRGLGDDLITDLARYPDLIVLADAISSTNPNNDVDFREHDNKPVANYILNGSVQASSSKIRVNIKLIETLNRSHVWAAQYEKPIGEFFSIQSDIVGHVVSAVGGINGLIPQAERLKLARTPPGDLQAYEIYLLGYELECQFQKQSAIRAFGLLERATKLEPNFARAWLVLGWMCWQIAMESWAHRPNKYRKLKHKAFKKAAALDPLDPFAVLELAAVRAIENDAIGAVDAVERALDLGRNRSDLLIAASNYVATLSDDPNRAVDILNRGLSLSSAVSEYDNLTVTRVAYFAGDFERALTAARRGPDNLPARLFETLSMAQLGQTEEVRERARMFAARHPAFAPQEYMKDHPITAAGAELLFQEGIEKARLT